MVVVVVVVVVVVAAVAVVVVVVQVQGRGQRRLRGVGAQVCSELMGGGAIVSRNEVRDRCGEFVLRCENEGSIVADFGICAS